jgi:hypothetical protein
LIEFLSRATTHQYTGPPSTRLFLGDEDVAVWKFCRRRIMQAVLQQDEELARFEAERYRQEILLRLRASEQQTS